MLKLNSFKKLLSIGFFILCFHLSNAAVKNYNRRISTTSTSGPVTIDSLTATTTVEVPAPYSDPSFSDKAVLDKITLGVDHSNLAYMPTPGDIKVTLLLEKWNAAGTLSTSSIDLVIKYQPFSVTTPYVDKTVYSFTDAYKYKITITNITVDGNAVNDLQANLFIDADIQLERYYDFTTNSSTIITLNTYQEKDIDCDGKNDELEISWTPINGAEEYQLEWTFVNDYDQSITGPYKAQTALTYDFKNNSTRITTSNCHYKITLAFEHGYLLYRVRGTGRVMNNPSQLIVGVWSGTGSSSTSDKGDDITNVPGKYYNQVEHEANKNWQYSTTYAEEGKKKEVVSYFDGSLRNRQSVTKVNSDKNTIVGETIYDFQGRPAVNVLPVPVAPLCSGAGQEPALRYYEKFNKVDATNAYSKNDFDTDMTPCSTQASPMNTVSGASNYYSPANPNKTGIQAFVPDAENYPFTQIEYTPDNTGRIRRQGGVGPEYQIGSGHETKYFYGSPNQIQLDRLFGSEVGNAAHYKKNLVIDANGQVSVSYLDQEGRTVATSLAGNAPHDLQNIPITTLEALPSESGAVKDLTVDLFAKDANGVSTINTKNVQADAIVFNSQLLVAYKSDYEFNYTLNIDTVFDACLKSNICFNCVYDLEIKVTDDCGNAVPTAPAGNQPVEKMVGHFNKDVNGDFISFKLDCSGPTPLTETETFKTNLDVGNYTVSKILTVNKDARDFYVHAYLDTLTNAGVKGQWVNLKDVCARNYQSFLTEALSHIDTADCNVTCASCIKSLMGNYPTIADARDAWVASGNGSEMDFDHLMEECDALCKPTISWCEASYQQLLMDVSPDGQYGEFQTADNLVAPGNFPLSVFNTANQLPKNGLGNAHWKNPHRIVNGTDCNCYAEEDGTPSIIKLIPDGNNYNPEVANTSNLLVKFDAVGNFYFTSPQNLLKVEDFVTNWKESWAKSIVQYHPEYCYYESCKVYGEKQTGDTKTTDEIDDLLSQTKTYQDAVTAGFIYPSYSTNNPPSSSGGANTLIKYMAKFVYTSTSTLKDPFLSNTTAYVNYAQLLKNKVDNYQTIGGISYSMIEVAAMTAICGTQYGTTPGSTCLKFGKKSATTPTAEDIRILDLEWNTFKNFYLSEKRKIQQRRADDIARVICNGFNGCIGNKDYNLSGNGMIDLTNYAASPFFNPQQPCGANTFELYLKKQQRFPSPQNLPSPSPEEMDYQAYLQTGQCPLAIDFQYLVSAIAAHGKLDNTLGESLVPYGEFTNDLYTAISGGTQPASFIPYTWKTATIAGNVLTANFINTIANSPVCSVTLNKGTTITNWADIIGISQLQYTATNGSNYEFKAMAAVHGTGTSVLYKPITGSTCVKITGCNFTPQCDANDLATDLSNLWTALNVNGVFLSTSPVVLNSTSNNYQLFITQNIKNALGTSSNDLRWQFNGAQFELYDFANPAKKLVIKFTTFTPSTYNPLLVKYFSTIKSAYQNFFTVKGVDVSNTTIVDIKGSVELVDGSNTSTVSMGTCGLSESFACTGDPYQLRTDLEALLKNVLLKNPFVGNNINLVQNPAYTDLIKSYFPVGLTQTSSTTVQAATALAYSETLNFTINSATGNCELNLHHGRNLPARYFDDLVELGSLTAYGTANADNNYYNFYLIGTYSVNGSSYTDTIFGKSCLPLQNCESCSQTNCFQCTSIEILPPASICTGESVVFNYQLSCTETPANLLWNFGDGTVSSNGTHVYTSPSNYIVELSTVSGPNCLDISVQIPVRVNACPMSPMMLTMNQPIYYNQMDSVGLANGTLISDTTLNAYMSYTNGLNELASINNWPQGDTTYIDPASYSDYYMDGYKYNLKVYNDFVENFDSALDDPMYLKNVEAFIADFGNFTNCEREYLRYTKGVFKYNQRALHAGVAQIQAIDRPTFDSNMLCDYVRLYLKYLKFFPKNGLTPVDAITFLNGINSLPPNNSQCAILYIQYYQAYTNFVQQQQMNSTCPNYPVVSPLYSYEDFVSNGLCSGAAGYTKFRNYFLTFNTVPPCPGPMPGTGAHEKTCQQLFTIFKRNLRLYNKSPYALAHPSSKLTVNIYGSFAAFMEAGLCDCIAAYIAYLQPYLTAPANSTLPPPVDINHFPGCFTPVTPVADPCADAYTNYISTVTNYNQYAINNHLLMLPGITNIYTETAFVSANYCNCMTAYSAFIQTIIDGTADLSMDNRAHLYLQLDIANTCEPAPCTGTVPQDTVVFPLAPYSNPCAEYQINLAYANAQNAYNQYVDDLTTSISDKYTSHCLNALETFTTRYNDKEYHFTMYYYDQAGNLIRTIPPEGVELVNMDPSQNTNADDINKDRTNNQHNFFTNHRMATTYEYNSLNQLVKQNMPDHDPMDIWDLTLPNGLDKRLKVTATQFVSSTKGYLSGFIDVPVGSPAYNNKRGCLYTTDDGGASWTKMNDLIASDLKKIQMIPNTTIGYAVGTNGILLKTMDGGNTWDMKQVYKSNVTAQINDLYFIDDQKGIVINDNGFVQKTTDGGTSFSTEGSFSDLNLISVTYATYNGFSYFYLTGNNVDKTAELRRGKINVTANNITINWEAASVISVRTTSDIVKMQIVTGDKGFAIGSDGTLLSTDNAGTKWTSVATGIKENFRDIYFKKPDPLNTSMKLWEGVAIIDSIPGKGLIWKTNNGGVTWTLLSNHDGTYYNGFNFYSNDKGYAVGTNGKMKRIIMSGNYGLVNIPTPVPAFTINAASFSDGDKGWIVGNNQNIYFTQNATASVPAWTAVNTGLSGADANFKDIEFGEIGNTNTTANKNNGILLTATTGKLYKIKSTSLGGTIYTSPLPQLSVAGENYIDIAADNTNVIAYNAPPSSTAPGLRYVAKNNISSATTLGPVATNGMTANLANVVSVYVGNNTPIFTLGKNGDIFKIGGVGGSTWTDQSKNIIPLALWDIQAAGTNTVYAVGNKGTLLQTTNGTDFKIIPISTVKKLNAVKFNTNNTVVAPSIYYGLIAGDDGSLWKNTVNNGACIPAPISVPVSNDLYDVAVNTSGKAYAVGEQGMVISIPDITIASPSATISSLQQGAFNFYGVCFKLNSNSIYVVGDKSSVYTYNNTSGAKIKSVYTPGLNDVHFVNTQNGYTVGDNGCIRHTKDGGLTWKYILPTNTGTTNIVSPPLNGVYTVSTQPDVAYIIGNGKYVAKINDTIIGTILSSYVSSNSENFNDIAFDKTGKGYVVGNNASIRTITNNVLSITSIVPTTISGFNFNALHIFNDNSFIAVGSNSKVYTYKSGTFTLKNDGILPLTTPGVTLNDVYFHDDRTGYVVGDAGKIFRCSVLSNITSSSVTNNNIWVSQTSTDNSAPIASSFNINAIAFATRYNGFMAGQFTGANTSTYPYARLLRDELKLFSTRFWYDRLGRMVVSQNTKQYNRKNSSVPANLQDFSYTLYDELGRIIEVGEKTDTTAANFASIFGEYVNGQFNPNVINDVKYKAWIYGSGRREVTKTYYDNNIITGLPITQENLRKRVSTVVYQNKSYSMPPVVDQKYQHATHYSYDIHGNVKTLIQDNKKLYDDEYAQNPASPLLIQRFKRIDYEYDLISGKVNLVRYQDGQPDAMYHFYAYDADNRITDVYTSNYPQANTLINEGIVANNPLWDKDAKYFYYAHGPLARVEIGDNEVQGIDYAYNLQGWIKGVNSNTLDKTRDIGQDGLTTSVNSVFAKDAFGYTLNYHNNDYKAIGIVWNTNTNRFEAVTTGSDLMASRYDLFNGNITSMVTTIEQPMIYTSSPNQTPIVLPQGTAYKYDQLNRIQEMKAWDNLTASTNTWSSGSTYANRYHNIFDYDPNGNILYQERADASGVIFDKLTYRYKIDNPSANGSLPAIQQKRLQNRLYHVNDGNLNATLATDDIDDEGAWTPTHTTINTSNNYSYDEIGNLTKDTKEEIANVEWNVSGKIKRITRLNNSLKSDLEFNYDASGNRISKIEKPRDASGQKPQSEWITTYYTRDAQGNIMTTYKLAPASLGSSFKVIERNIFGSSRVGTDNAEIELINALPTANPFTRTLGNKHYEGSNHLGNVLAVFTDRKIPVTTDGTTIDHFDADVVNTFDYTPFGAPMNERSYRLVMKYDDASHTTSHPEFVNGNEPIANIASENLKYRYGFNGKEKDDEVKGAGNCIDYGMRISDPRLGGRFFSVDPLIRTYPWLSSYQFAGNTPIQALDLDGLEILDFRASYTAKVTRTEMDNQTVYEITINNGDAAQHVHSNISNHEPSNQFVSVPSPNQGTLEVAPLEYPKQISTGEMGKQQKYDQSGKQNGANAIAGVKGVEFVEKVFRKLAEVNTETSAQDDFTSQKAFGIASEVVNKYDNLLKSALGQKFDAKNEETFLKFKADVINQVVDKRSNDATSEYGTLVKNIGNFILNKEDLNAKTQSAQSVGNKALETYKKVAGGE